MGWFTRVVEVEKLVVVEKIVFGTPEPVTLYMASDPQYKSSLRYGNYRAVAAEWDGRHFLSCEQAFAECPGAEVLRVERWLLDGKYLRQIETEEITVQPKPKREKGA